jgi:membrane-associated phospholipid phosphatase
MVRAVMVASLDSSWYRSVNEFARDTGWAHVVLANYANWAGLVLLALLLVTGWLLGRRRPDAPRCTATAFLVGIGAVLALVANHAIGPAVARMRPCHALTHVEVLLHCASDSSFPSDHAMIAGAFAAGLLLLSRRIGLAALLLALLLAFARVYVGVHYPSDVAGGLAIGTALGALVVLTLRPATAAVALRLARTPLRPLIVSR